MTNVERFEKEQCGVSACKGGNPLTFLGLIVALVAVFAVFGQQ